MSHLYLLQLESLAVFFLTSAAFHVWNMDLVLRTTETVFDPLCELAKKTQKNQKTKECAFNWGLKGV